MTKKIINSLILLIILAALSIGFFYYLKHQRLYPNTDDAYVQANVVYIAPQVNGKIAAIYVKNHQKVKKGQALFDIDPKPYQIALNEAKAKLANSQQIVKAEQSSVEAARSLVAERVAQLTNVKRQYTRIMTLVNMHLYAVAKGDKIQSELKVAQAELQAAKSQLNEAQQKLGQPGPQNATIRTAKAAVAQAELNLQHTHIVAPAAGFLAKFDLRVGAEVTAYQQLFALIENNSWWVNTNFKETDLIRIKPGQSATIKIDMYSNHLFKGVVTSISAGSGASFSLLPPENATGNWVKVTQRFPVRIKILNPNPKYPLRIGASSTVTINTTRSS